MKNYGLILIIFLIPTSDCYNDFFSHIKTSASENVQKETVERLITRLIPGHAQKFAIFVNSTLLTNGKDVFSIQKLDSGIVQITGSSGVSAATGLHHYLKYYCNCHISWEASNLNLPSDLPSVNITVYAQDRFRYYQNVCTSSYSFSWWQWKDWEKHIDWMALNSYNLVLTLTGVEAIWKRVYSKLSLTEADINAHFPGPAFLAWGRMGNIRGWRGPLSDTWHRQTLKLQHQILDRMRNFGIVSVLPAFAGHVPRAIERIYPEAKLTKTQVWNKFNDTYCCPYLLDPTDPLFKFIGNVFMEELINEFGTDHMYSCDTFNEMLPDNGSASYLHDIGQSVYAGMSTVDPQAVWVMQSWLFIHEIVFWTPERVKALLTSVPQGKMILLDLQSEQHPQYNRFESYYGQPYIWCMLHNFGGTLGMFGSINTINTEVINARRQVNSTMVGTGITPEGINQNYILYDFMGEASWRSGSTDLTTWFSNYVTRRYGKKNYMAIKSWQILKNSVYNFTLIVPMRGKYVVTRRPSTRIIPWIWYDACDLLQAWKFLLESADELNQSEAYRHDLTDLTRQVLQVFVDNYYKKVKQHFRARNVTEFQKVSSSFLDLFNDLEKTLRSGNAFLLGNWLEAAKSMASNIEEEKLYEYNARNQVTLWGPKGEINDYACKQWSGMVSDYYYQRWSLFITSMNTSLINNVAFNETTIIKKIFTEVEEPFTFSTKEYSTHSSGDIITIAQHLKEKWWPKQHCRFPRANDFNLNNLFEHYPSVVLLN